MRYVRTDTGGPTSDARRARGGADPLLGVCALALAVCAASPSRAHGQAATAGRGAVATLDRSANMTELNTAYARRTAPADHAASADTHIRPFRVRMPQEKLTE